ncbi:MAG: hypothetical protein K2M76_03695 [Muribaculaceae bacterium]|nr:hypothetical protein [Muribaculaceae bacterium]
MNSHAERYRRAYKAAKGIGPVANNIGITPNTKANAVINDRTEAWKRQASCVVRATDTPLLRNINGLFDTMRIAIDFVMINKLGCDWFSGDDKHF